MDKTELIAKLKKRLTGLRIALIVLSIVEIILAILFLATTCPLMMVFIWAPAGGTLLIVIIILIVFWNLTRNKIQAILKENVIQQ